MATSHPSGGVRSLTIGGLSVDVAETLEFSPRTTVYETVTSANGRPRRVEKRVPAKLSVEILLDGDDTLEQIYARVGGVVTAQMSAGDKYHLTDYWVEGEPQVSDLGLKTKLDLAAVECRHEAR